MRRTRQRPQRKRKAPRPRPREQQHQRTRQQQQHHRRRRKRRIDRCASKAQNNPSIHPSIHTKGIEKERKEKVPTARAVKIQSLTGDGRLALPIQYCSPPPVCFLFAASAIIIIRRQADPGWWFAANRCCLIRESPRDSHPRFGRLLSFFLSFFLSWIHSLVGSFIGSGGMGGGCCWVGLASNSPPPPAQVRLFFIVPGVGFAFAL